MKKEEFIDYTRVMNSLYESIYALKDRILVQRDQDKYFKTYRNIKRNFDKLENNMMANGDL